MSFNLARPGKCVFATVALVVALHAIGCGGSRYPVDGRVLFNGAPLKGKEGAVVLKPDASKGNKSAVAAVGVLEPDGSFKVRPGAPRGWYKVIITATEPGANPNNDTPRVLNVRYEAEATTPLAIEVVAQPGEGGYDLQVSP